jgi:quinol monooxygenase YgiN
MRTVTISAAVPASIVSAAANVTLINVFSVEHDKQEAVIQALIRATDEVMRHVPGFVSASIHQSLDGTKVTNYAQWRSREDFEAMLGDSAAQRHMAEVAALAVRFEPTLYNVVSVHVAPTEHL